jgi:hypothetical protein
LVEIFLLLKNALFVFKFYWDKYLQNEEETNCSNRIFFALIIACNQKDKKSNSSKFTGLWSLYIMEQQDTISGEWREWRNGMQGYILYDGSENMSLHHTTKGYEDTKLRFPNFVDTISNEALKHLSHS